jgi:hypothetical protein
MHACLMPRAASLFLFTMVDMISGHVQTLMVADRLARLAASPDHAPPGPDSGAALQIDRASWAVTDLATARRPGGRDDRGGGPFSDESLPSLKLTEYPLSTLPESFCSTK